MSINVLEIMDKIYFFSSFSDEDKQTISKFSKLIKYSSGRDIISQGDLSLSVLILVRGKVVITVDGEEVVKVSSAGQVFGEMGIVNHTTASATVKADEDCIFLKIDYPSISKLTDSKYDKMHMCFYRSCAEILAKKLQSTNQITKTYAEKIHKASDELSSVDLNIE